MFNAFYNRLVKYKLVVCGDPLSKIIKFFSKTIYYFPGFLRIIYSRYIMRWPTVGVFPGELYLHDKFWERRLKVSTTGLKDTELHDGLRYEATPYLLIRDIFDRMALTEDDVLVDLGCGKARTLCFSERFCKAKLLGVEYDNKLADTAKENLKNTAVEVSCMKAQDFDYSKITAIYLYNPFGEKTVAAVLEKLHQSLIDNPRKVKIAYANPVHDDLLASLDWLEFEETWSTKQYPHFYVFPRHGRAVSFWHTKI